MSVEPPKDRRRRRTQAAVLDAAERLFANDGYRTTSVDALAEAADVALSSIYANFPGGKADVYAVLACRVAGEHAEQMKTAAVGTDAEGRLLAAFDAYVDFHRDRPFAFRLLGLADVDDRESDVVARARAHIDAVLLGVVADVVAGVGSARPVVLLAWATVNGVLGLRHRGAIDVATAEELIRMAREDNARRIAAVLDELG